MTLDQVFDWWDRFYEEFVERKKIVRGRCFSGGRIELWDRDNIVIVLHDPYLRGKTEDDKAADFIKNLFDDDHQSIRADISLERLEKIVSGEETLTDKDWSWQDE